MSTRFPYISITDFTSPDQVREMLNVFREHCSPGKDVHYKLGIGVMMSYKTLNGLETRWANIFPPKENIADIFISDNIVGKPNYWLLNTIHYADYDGIDILNNILKATAFGGEHMNALQLDMVWPDPEILQEYRGCYPNIQTILQVSSLALDRVDNNPAKLFRKLKPYRDALDYVLLDKSMGRGIGMDAQALLPFVQYLKQKRFEVVIAGGLGPNTIHLLGKISDYLPSIDAQSKLRPSGKATDPIDLDFCAEYLKKAIRQLGIGQ